MGSSSIVVLLVLLASWICVIDAQLVLGSVCGRNSATRLAADSGGRVAVVVDGDGDVPGSSSDWPWMASLGDFDRLTGWVHVCGGTLLTDSHVLTAAHCVLPKVKFVRLGYSSPEGDQGLTQFREIRRRRIHPLFVEGLSYYDVAVVVLRRPATFGAAVVPACVPDAPALDDDDDDQEDEDEGVFGEVDKYAGDSVTVTGFGLRDRSSARPETRLRHGRQVVFPQAFCNETHARGEDHIVTRIARELLPGLFQSNLLCAGDELGGVGSCKGDSGGPLVRFTQEGGRSEAKYLQIGLVQGGLGACGDAEFPSIYVRLEDRAVHQFIQNTLRGSSDMIIAVRAGDLQLVGGLLGGGAPIDEPGSADGITPLMAAIQSRRLAVSVHLVESGADVRARTKNSRMTAAHYAAAADLPSVLSLLSVRGADLAAVNRVGETPMYLAAKHGCERCIKLLLDLRLDHRVGRVDGRTPIRASAESGHPDAFRLLWERYEDDGEEADLASSDAGGDLLLLAARAGMLEAVGTLVRAGAAVDHRDRLLNTALLEALSNVAITDPAEMFSSVLPPTTTAEESNHIQVAKFLLHFGADVNAANRRRQSAIHLAVQTGLLEAVQMVVEAGGNVSAEHFFNIPFIRSRDPVGTPLMLAAYHGHAEVASYLLSRGADPNYEDDIGQTALHKAALGERADVVALLLDAGADATVASDDDWEMAIHVAARVNCVDCVRAFVDREYDLLSLLRPVKGDTALHVSADMGATDVSKYLLSLPDLGPKLAAARDPKGFLPLHRTAVVSGDLEVAKIILDNKLVDPDALAKRDITTLTLAARNGFVEIVKALIEAGADIDWSIGDGQTSLHLAADNRQHDVVAVLLEAGADHTAEHELGITPLFVSHTEETSRLLLEAGSDPSALSSDLDTPLHWAAREGLVGVTRVLLEYGVDETWENESGDTALDIALEMRHNELAALLSRTR